MKGELHLIDEWLDGIAPDEWIAEGIEKLEQRLADEARLDEIEDA